MPTVVRYTRYALSVVLVVVIALHAHWSVALFAALTLLALELASQIFTHMLSILEKMAEKLDLT